MDEKLKRIDEFNGKLKAFNGEVKTLEDWLPVGRKRMDELLKPTGPISAEDRVVQTMELQACKNKCKQTFLRFIVYIVRHPIGDGKVHDHQHNLERSLANGECRKHRRVTSKVDTPMRHVWGFLMLKCFALQEFQKRLDTVQSTQNALLDEVKVECAKFGDDVKYLADFTSGVKKFDPWIQKSEAKKAVGMLKPTNLQEALDQLEEAKVLFFYFCNIFSLTHFNSKASHLCDFLFLNFFLNGFQSRKRGAGVLNIPPKFLLCMYCTCLVNRKSLK